MLTIPALTPQNLTAGIVDKAQKIIAFLTAFALLTQAQKDATTLTLRDTTNGSNLIPNFGSEAVPNQSYIQNIAISPLQLPTATSGDGTLVYSTSTPPPGINYNPITRQLTGTPTVVGTTAMVFTVTDDDGDTDTLTFNITVDDGTTDTTPTINTIANQSAIVSQYFSVNIGVTSGNSPFTFTVSGNPSWLSLLGANLRGTPTAAGTHNITITVEDDDGDTDTESFTLTVTDTVTDNSLDNEKQKPVVAQMTLKDSSGGDVEVYLSASFPDFDHDSNTYEALLTPDALSPIRRSIDNVGGLSEESTTAIALVNALSAPLYDPETHTYIGQPIKIFRLLPDDSLHELYSGRIRRYFETLPKLSLDISPQIVQRLRVLPYGDLFHLKRLSLRPQRTWLARPSPYSLAHWNTLEDRSGL